MKILPEVYIVAYRRPDGKIDTPVGTHRNIQNALAANKNHFGLEPGNALSYSRANLFKHILTMLTPGLYTQQREEL